MDKLTGGTLLPAYGRDYKNRASIIVDLNAGKDFVIRTYTDDGYCSIRDLSGIFQVRDRSQRKVWSVKVSDGVAK